jgi:hypothetical protein
MSDALFASLRIRDEDAWVSLCDNFPFPLPHLCLQEELHDYYRLLAVLEQEMQITSKTGILSAAYKLESRLVQKPVDLQSHRRRSGETGKTGAEGSAEVEGDAGAPGLTLLRLRAWLQEPIER